MEKLLDGARVLVTGGTGFLGKYVMAALAQQGAKAIPISRRLGYDLRNEAEVLQAFLIERPDIVVHLAATVGGIGANMLNPATFFKDNLVMGVNIVHAAAMAGCKLVAVGTICSFPKDCPTPFREEDFWNGYPEETNAPYGIAKKAIHVMCEAYRKQHGLHYGYLVPCNLFGMADNFDEKSSHVIPAMIRRFVEAHEAEAPEVTCWGTGKATRSFLFAPDAAKAIAIACAELDSDKIVNLPGSEEITMKRLAETIAKILKYKGRINFDATRPDGQPKRLVDGTRARQMLGWAPETTLHDGLEQTIDWFLELRRKAAALV
jgi:GDP-L-fucose synthase